MDEVVVKNLLVFIFNDNDDFIEQTTVVSQFQIWFFRKPIVLDSE